MRPFDLCFDSFPAHHGPNKPGLAQGHLHMVAGTLKERTVSREGLADQDLGIVEIIEVVARP